MTIITLAKGIRTSHRFLEIIFQIQKSHLRRNHLLESKEI